MMYRVNWLIDIEADNHEEAARKALTIQRDPESIGDVFMVAAPGGDFQMVDLSAIDDERIARHAKRLDRATKDGQTVRPQRKKDNQSC